MTNLTTTSGNIIGDNQNSLTAGERGLVLLQDYMLLEKLAHQNRERIPERAVHANGTGVYGELEIREDISKYTKAKVLQKGEKTKMLLRFSTVAGEAGAADGERDVRGTAMKFYTKEGNWDLVGNNTPVFFIKDPLKFPDFIHTQKRHPRTNLRSTTAMWDFWSNSPESLHQITILFSDRGIPKSYANMNLYGSHTYSLINDKNERFWVKFHFKTKQGIKNLSNEEAQNLIAKDRESHQRDMVERIENKNFPQWDFKIQIMSEEEARTYKHNPFDLTKVWNHKDFPLIDVGVLTLNELPQNYFNEVEQACFSPSNIVPGIGFSPDKMLQARIFSYPDAQRYRIGKNYDQLPVNRAISEVNTYHAAGAMNTHNLLNTDAYYEPNSYADAPKENKEFLEPPLHLEGEAYRYNHREDSDDYYSQARDLFNLMDEEEKKRLCMNNISKEEEKRYEELQILALNFARKGETTELEKMIKAGLSVNLKDHKGNSLLMLSSYNLNYKTSEMLLQYGANVDEKNDKGQTPLAGVCFKGSLDLVKLLVENKADVNADNGMGTTPITFAKMFGHKKIVEYLIKNNAKEFKISTFLHKIVGNLYKKP